MVVYSLFSQRDFFAKNAQKSGGEGIEESRDMPQKALESLYSDPTSPKYKGQDSPQGNIS